MSRPANKGKSMRKYIMNFWLYDAAVSLSSGGKMTVAIGAGGTGRTAKAVYNNVVACDALTLCNMIQAGGAGGARHALAEWESLPASNAPDAPPAPPASDSMPAPDIELDDTP